MKEQRARAHAALVVEDFFSEIVLTLSRGSEFQQNLFLRLFKKEDANAMPLALFWHLFGPTFGGQVVPIGVIFLMFLK